MMRYVMYTFQRRPQDGERRTSWCELHVWLNTPDMEWSLSRLHALVRQRFCRRSEQRITLDIPCAVVARGRAFPGMIEDCSERGLLVRLLALSDRIPPECIVRLVKETSPFALTCRIMWRRPVGADLRVGLHIIEVPAWVITDTRDDESVAIR